LIVRYLNPLWQHSGFFHEGLSWIDKMPLWLVVTMGAVVMLIVLAVMLPIIQLNQFVR
jgi:hypothetical protein